MASASYMVQADVDLNTGADAELWVFYVDANNGYRVTFDNAQQTLLHGIKNGIVSSAGTGAFPADGTAAVKIKATGSTIKVWVDGTLETTHNLTGIGVQPPHGAVAFGGAKPKFDNAKVDTTTTRMTTSTMWATIWFGQRPLHPPASQQLTTTPAIL